MARTVAIVTPEAAAPLVRTAATLLRQRLRERGGVRPATPARAEVRITLAVQPGIGAEGFRIPSAEVGAITIAGNDPRGVLYGVGRFLRDCRFGRRKFTPGTWCGTSVPTGRLRGMYFATHFHNFFLPRCTAQRSATIRPGIGPVGIQLDRGLVRHALRQDL